MSENKKITVTWLLLLALTLTSIVIADGTPDNAFSVVLVCFIVAVKGQLVIDKLVGLRLQNQKIRWVMLSYFYLLPPIFIIGILYPQLLQF